jgi:general secretion pathway protein J
MTSRQDEHGFTSLRRSAEHGFTLVELMVALLIFGMIAAAGVSLLGFSVTAQAAASERLGEMASLRRMASLMTNDLAQAVPRQTRNEAGDPTPAFIGTGTGGAAGEPLLVLVRGGWSNLDRAPRASLQKVEYRLTDGRLERRSWPMLDGAAAGEPAVLMTEVESVTARYRSEGEWRDLWDATRPGAMPSAVELRLRQRDRPEIVQLFLVGTAR